jgi:hypothetical protein
VPGFSNSVDIDFAGIAGIGVFSLFLISFFIASKIDFFKTIYWFLSHVLMLNLGFLIALFNNIDHQPEHYAHHINNNFHSIQASIDNEFKDSDYYQKLVLAIHQIDYQKVHGKALLQVPKKIKSNL